MPTPATRSRTSTTCSRAPAQDIRDVRRAGAGPRRRCCSSPRSASAWWRSWSTCCAVGLRRPALAGLPMLAIYSVPVAVLAGQRRPSIPFVFGAGRVPLAAGHRQRRPGPPVRPPVHRRGPRRRRVGAVAAGRGRPAAGVVGVVARGARCRWPCPGMTTGLLDRFGTGPGRRRHRAAGSGGARPGRPLRRAERPAQPRPSVATLVKVTTNDPTPFYLRFGVADQLDRTASRNRAAAAARPSTEALPDPRCRAGRRASTSSATGPRSRSAGLRHAAAAGLHRADRRSRSSTATGSTTPDLQVVFSSRGTRRRARRYSFDYVRSHVHARRRCAARRRCPHDDPVRRQFTAVPDDAARSTTSSTS